MNPSSSLPTMSASTAFVPLLLFFIAILAESAAANVVKLDVHPKILNKSGDSVRIEWSGIPNPYALDWLGVYNPASSDHKNFIGYVFLSSSPNWKSGSGFIDLPLLNLRSSYQFRIFNWNESEINKKHRDHDQNPLPGTRHLLATSEEVSFANYNDPAQIHLAFGSNDDEMRVLFITRDGIKSFARYGLKRDELDEIAEASTTTYSRSDMCDSPANSDGGWRDPGNIHDAVMKNLKAGARYYYQVGSDEGGWSSTYSFISKDKDSGETNAFLFGDMGTSFPYATFIRTQEESKSTVRWIQRDIENLGDKSAFISHIGDISYARGYAWIWDSFFTQIEPLASKVPYHVCIGNHEYDWPSQPWRPSWSYAVYGTDGGGECGVPYSLKFNMPGNSALPTGNGVQTTRNLYYSIDVGVVHFLYISTETNFLPGSDQYAFIKSDLESVNREKTPFIVVQGHRPMYTTSNEVRDAPHRARMLEHLEPLFVSNRVSLALWGHVHRYERFCPLKNFTCGGQDNSTDNHFTMHMVIGMGGQDWQPIWEPRPDHPDVPIYPQPARSLYRGGEFGYVRLHATREKMSLTYVGNHDGMPHDTVDILGKGVKEAIVHTSASRYVQGGSLLVVGTLVGFLIGFLVHARKDANHRSWSVIKSDEM
ncbi:probable inactive purple acid phosphatase 2 [Nymphaea colorata]|nr:probable inactive purple acid phosphatase 2 [Nymphaea colorata]